MSALPTAINARAPNRSKMGPTWMPTKKTMNKYRLKIQPISDAVLSTSWCVEKYDSNTAAELISPNSETIALKEPSTTSQPVRPPSGKSMVVAAEGWRASGLGGRLESSESEGSWGPVGFSVVAVVVAPLFGKPVCGKAVVWMLSTAIGGTVSVETDGDCVFSEAATADVFSGSASDKVDDRVVVVVVQLSLRRAFPALSLSCFAVILNFSWGGFRYPGSEEWRETGIATLILGPNWDAQALGRNHFKLRASYRVK